MKKLTTLEGIPNQFFKPYINNEDYPNDKALILGISENNLEAFQLLFDRYWETLYLYACGKMPSAVEAKFIIERLYVHIWESRNWLDPQKNAESYLFEELKKKIVNFYAYTFFK